MGVANRALSGSQGVALPLWEVIGGQTLIPNGANTPATLPTGTEIIHISSEGGSSYYSFSPIASASSPGFVPDGSRVIEGPIRDLNNFAVFAAADVSVHLIYYRENKGR